MGRKEGGSLFHQMINAPGVMELAYRKGKHGEPLPVSITTRKSYQQFLHHAAEYFKARGIRRIADIGLEQVQEYEKALEAEGKTPSTIHSYLAPLCKAVGISMDEISKPIRHGADFTRSGGKYTSDGGRPAEFNAMVGIRENELRHLYGNDILERNGYLYVVIRKGKGGKYQEQRVLPQYAEQVRKFFDGSDKKFFLRSEFSNKFDYHGQRRALAKEAMAYYADRLAKEPGYRKQLYEEIKTYWKRCNPKNRDKLEPMTYFNKLYVLRGKNRKLAEEQGKPVVLDRLVLRAVSVFHLAHWRDDVTIQSYYFDRGYDSAH